MSLGTLRLARRSMELIHMTLSEVQQADTKHINGEVFHIIKVVNQKNLKMGEPAPVVYNDVEFQVLNIYIRKMRPMLTEDQFNPIVFPSQHRGSSYHMTFSSFNKILDKLQTKSGKKVSSRVIRGSKITSNRSLNVSDSDRRHLAKAMSHSLNTAERYYNYSDVTNSVVETLSINRGKPSAVSAENQMGSLNCLIDKGKVHKRL